MSNLFGAWGGSPFGYTDAYSTDAYKQYKPTGRAVLAMQEAKQRRVDMEREAAAARWYEGNLMPMGVAKEHKEPAREPDIDSLGPLKYLQARKNQWLNGVLK